MEEIQVNLNDAMVFLESVLEHLDEESKKSRWNKPLNLISMSIFEDMEEIVLKKSNLLVYNKVLTIVDFIMSDRLFSIGNKDTDSIFNYAQFIIDIAKPFDGTYIAERAIGFSKDLLVSLLERKMS